MKINVKYNKSVIFTTLKNVNVEASVALYEKMFLEAVKAEYPDAEITLSQTENLGGIKVTDLPFSQCMKAQIKIEDIDSDVVCSDGYIVKL